MNCERNSCYFGGLLNLISKYWCSIFQHLLIFFHLIFQLMKYRSNYTKITWSFDHYRLLLLLPRKCSCFDNKGNIFPEHIPTENAKKSGVQSNLPPNREIRSKLQEKGLAHSHHWHFTVILVCKYTKVPENSNQTDPSHFVWIARKHATIF